MSKAMNREKFRVIIQPVTPIPGFNRGLWNGYITVPQEHPWYGKSYDEIDARVHGGVTFADWFCDREGDDWMIGFDTAHYGDTAKSWPIERVARECNNLLGQACMETYEVDGEEVL